MEDDQYKLPLLIAQVEPPQKSDGGDYFHRTHAPGTAMAQEEGVYVVNLTNEHRKKFDIMAQADVLILKNICDPDLLPLIAKRISKGKLTVYEIADDVNALQPWNPVYFFYKNKENLALVHRLAACCNALQVTCSELKKLYGYLNHNCAVFPNQILNVPPERLWGKKENITIGWGGSHGHLEDIAEISTPLMSWLMTQPNVSLHFMCSEPIWRLFDSLPQHKKRHTPPGSIDDYYSFLAQIDIGITPLKDTAYNRSRSDVKYLEYAISGVVPVMKRLEPYIESVDHGKTGFLFNDSNELIGILKRLVNNPTLLVALSNAARQYVIQDRLQVEHGKDRVNFYRNELSKLGQRDSSPERPAECFNR